MHATRWPALALAALTLMGSHLLAADAAKEPAKSEAVLPKPSEITALAVHPAKIHLKGIDDAQQFILTAALAGGKKQDLSGDVQYEVGK